MTMARRSTVRQSGDFYSRTLVGYVNDVVGRYALTIWTIKRPLVCDHAIVRRISERDAVEDATTAIVDQLTSMAGEIAGLLSSYQNNTFAISDVRISLDPMTQERMICAILMIGQP